MKKILDKILSIRMRTKIALTIFFIILLFSFGVGLVIRNTVLKKTNQIIKNSIENLVKVNEAMVLKNLLEENYWNIFKIMNSLKQIELIKEATFVDQNYNVIASSKPSIYPVDSRLNNLHPNPNLLIIPLKSEDIVFGYFIIDKEPGFLHIMIQNIKNQLVLAIIVAAFISILIGYLMSIRIVGRLELLSDNAKMIENEKWDNMKYQKSIEKDEISELSFAFNNMLTKIKKMITNEQIMKKFYYDILENLDELVIICDKNFNIKFHNTNKLRKLIIEDELFTPKVLKIIKENRTKKSESFVIEVPNEKGNILHLHANMQNISDEYAFTFSNITSLKKLEEQELFKNSFEIVGEISSEVVHEIKNHLQPIKLLLEQEELDTEDRQRVLNIIFKINRLVKNFLKSGRPIDKKLSVNIPIKEIIENILFALAQKFEEKNINLSKDIDSSLSLYMAELDFNSIFTNLLANAIDACEIGGEICISCKEKNKNIILKVINTGKEIDQEIVRKIHKPFFTTKRDGSGIGLYIVYKIVYLYGGFINIESNHTRTIFSVHLPQGIHYANSNH